MQIEQISLIAKVFFLSLAVSLVIKYLSPQWGVPATMMNALIAIALPSCIMAMLLWRRSLS